MIEKQFTLTEKEGAFICMAIANFVLQEAMTIKNLDDRNVAIENGKFGMELQIKIQDTFYGNRGTIS